jgi:retinol dehydrogenase-12
MASPLQALAQIPALFYRQWTFTPPPQTQSFANQVVIVTGANQGLGFEAARRITANGAAKVILAVRSASKGAEAKKDIEKSTNTTGVVEVWPLDLADYESVKAFAAKANELDRLDVLLNNAGVSLSKWTVSDDEEMTIKVNVISTFLLSFLLLPKLRESAKKYNITPHLTIVSSEVHFFAAYKERKHTDEPLFDVLSNERKSSQMDRYNVSKLLEVLTVRELANKVGSKYPVTINTINPGFCHSSLMRDVGFAQYIAKFVMGARTTEVGSRTLVNAASFSPDSHGQYLSDCKIEETAPFVNSEEGKMEQKRVWTELVTVLEKIQPGIMKNL